LRLFKNVYGEYADKRQVRLDALEATADARQLRLKGDWEL
jgi:hypothetical protein